MENNFLQPFINKLTNDEIALLKKSAVLKKFNKGLILQAGQKECHGLFVINSGEFRVYTTNFDREITLYRLFEGDTCLFSASCIINNAQFDIFIEAIEDTEVWIIDAITYKKLMSSSTAIANYTNELMASKFSEVMWLLEQIVFNSFDKRLASFLLNELSISNSDTLYITHEKIANHIGSAREVVTRMLKHFQNEGILKLSRGNIKILDYKKLQKLSI